MFLAMRMLRTLATSFLIMFLMISVTLLLFMAARRMTTDLTNSIWQQKRFRERQEIEQMIKTDAPVNQLDFVRYVRRE